MIATELLIHDSYSRVTDEEVAMLHADRELWLMSQTLAGQTESDRYAFISRLRIGVQWNTEATSPGPATPSHRPTALHCQALTVTSRRINGNNSHNSSSTQRMKPR